jgi:hypothetical protein
MKRSEAVVKLSERIKLENLTRISANSQESDLADVLLRFLERDVGMQPPFSSNMFKLASTYFAHPDGFSWDPEEE